MKVLVVDDEPLAQQRLQSLLNEIDQVEIVWLADNGEQAIESAQKYAPDLILMDIRMPGMDGLEAAKIISQKPQSPAIIFTTAYDEYALEAFNVNAIDYLLKPVRANKLKQSISRASQLNKVQLAVIDANLETKVHDAKQKVRQNIAAKHCGDIKLIPVDEIIYFFAEQKYVTIFHQQGETIIEDTLKDLQQEFMTDFIRIHRNALVAKKSIRGLHKDRQGHAFLNLIESDKQLEISRRHLAEVKKIIRLL
jgi:two-component system, LytTR family, response regulator AlgR